MTLPDPLRAGSRVAVISPSGPIQDDERFTRGLAVLRTHFTVDVVGPLSTRNGLSFLSGPDPVRASALRKALRTADAVWYSRGGYGSARLLSSTGWDRPGPWIIGFSDATALLWARYAHGLLGGVHGPVVSGLGAEPPSSVARLMALLSNNDVEPLPLHRLGGSVGVAAGPVIAGNLTVATSLLGTRFMPDLTGHILVFEDVAEPPYKVDRMLTQWVHSGALRDVCALVFGTFDAIPNPETYEVIAERVEHLGVPIYTCPHIGHHGEVAALAVGQRMRISRNRLHQIR